MQANRSIRFALVAAVFAATPSLVLAQGREFIVSTSGATALGAFTRMNNDSALPLASTINRGPLSVGTNFQIGTKVYAVPLSGVSYFGIANPSVPLLNEPVLGQDRVTYYYFERGSINGVNDLVNTNGLALSNNVPVAASTLGAPSGSNPLWLNGQRFTGNPTTPPNYINGRLLNTSSRVFVTAAADTNGVLPYTFAHSQPAVRIAYSDVKFQQGYSAPGTAASSRAPTQTGYGLGSGNVGGTGFQALVPAANVSGGVAPSTTRFRNEALAVVPFNLVANPGTGLAEVTKEQARWVQAVGRMPNGADFNSATRDVGSGTRNQGANNLNLDPSWSGGERDRRYLGTTTVASGGQNILNGGELPRTLNLNGTSDALQINNEHRVGLSVRFADKGSGSTGIRQVVRNSRMGLGILSSGDSASSSAGSALATAANGANPLRALRIDWDDAGANPGYQAKLQDVLNGRYQMWSAAQGITIAPYANPDSIELPFITPGGAFTSISAGNSANPTFNSALAYRPILNDLNDQTLTTVTDNTPINHGVHRKFLDNINKSVSAWSGAGSEVGPPDFIISAGFIPGQVMLVDKVYDGDAQFARPLNQVDPDGAGPLVSEQTLFNNVTATGTALDAALDWGNPSTTNGNVQAVTNATTANSVTTGVLYRVFATANNADSLPSANKQIVITARTNLVGDFNNDTVRDLDDVEAAALALSNPTFFLGTTDTTPNALNYSGQAVRAGQVTAPKIALTNAQTADDNLIVLSDFNSNGNVIADTDNAGFNTQVIERADIKFFLYGAAIDTSAQVGAQNKREIGVRTGTLKKNAAIDRFNAELDRLTTIDTDNVTAGIQPVITTTTASNNKFNKFDVDGSGDYKDAGANRFDAKLVDARVGLSTSNLEQVISNMEVPSSFIGRTNVNNANATFRIDLIDTELNDDGLITHVDPDGAGPLTSDMRLINNYMIANGLMTPGDANFTGGTGFGDLGILLGNYEQVLPLVGFFKWSQGDFNYDGVVGFADLGILLGAYDQSASRPAIDGSGLNLDPAAISLLESDGFVVIPEPMTLTLVAAAGFALTRRRNRR